MMQQINTFLSKKPDRKTLIIAMVILVVVCLCCLCLLLYLWRGPLAQNTPTPTASDTPTLTETWTITPSVTPTGTLEPSFTPTLTLTPSPTLTLTPSITFTPSITPTLNPLQGPEHLAVFGRTGNVWVTNRGANRLVELDGGDLHVVSVLQVDSPNGIAIWQDKGLAYITNKGPGMLTEVDLVAHKINRSWQVGSQPLGVSVIQTDGAVFVANYGSNSVSCIQQSSSQALTAVSPNKTNLTNPTHLYAWSYNTDLPDAAVVVDSAGVVAVVALNTLQSTTGQAACAFYQEATIGSDGLADVYQALSFNNGFYVSDKTGRKVVLIPSISSASRGVFTTLDLPNEPYAIADLGRCVAVVVPAQSRLFLIDIKLGSVVRQITVGKQGSNGGQGLAYNANVDVAYVTNQGDNSVSRIPHPCP